MLYYTPNILKEIYAKNHIQVEVIAMGKNGKSEPLHIDIFWDGKWDDDDEKMRQHLVLKQEFRSKALPKTHSVVF